MSTTHIVRACKELTEDHSPSEWISYLFDLQTQMIANNHFEAYTHKGFQDHAEHFAALKTFFENLNNKPL